MLFWRASDVVSRYGKPFSLNIPLKHKLNNLSRHLSLFIWLFYYLLLYLCFNNVLYLWFNMKYLQREFSFYTKLTYWEDHAKRSTSLSCSASERGPSYTSSLYRLSIGQKWDLWSGAYFNQWRTLTWAGYLEYWDSDSSHAPFITLRPSLPIALNTPWNSPVLLLYRNKSEAAFIFSTCSWSLDLV